MIPKAAAYLVTFSAFIAALVILSFLFDPYRITLGKYVPRCDSVWVMACKRAVP